MGIRITHRTTRIVAIGAMLAAIPATAQAAPAAHRSGGDTITVKQVNATAGSVKLGLDPAVQSALNAFGSVTAVSPASGSVASGLTMPVKAGRVVYMQRTRKDGSIATTRIISGYLNLNGGFTITRGSTTIAITDVRADLWEGRNGRIEAKVNGTKKRYDLFSLASPTVDPVARTVSAKLRLTEHGVKLVNAAAGKVVVSNRTAIGTATLALP